jgi:hypothetical protein
MGSYQYYRQIFEVDTSGRPWYLPEYHRTIQAFEAAFLLGYQVQLGRRLSIDFWGGVGARYSIHRWSPTKCPHPGPFLDRTGVGDPHFAARWTTRTPLRALLSDGSYDETSPT